MKCKDLTEQIFNQHSVLKNHPALLSLIKQTFDANDAILIVKAPGRVNLIGEHTDYNMGPVLPCAIDKEMVFAICPNSTSQICVKNVDPDFDEVCFSLDDSIIPYDKGHWGNYIKAGVKGVVDHLSKSNPADSLTGFDAVVSGTLPKAAGLSSSSALVVVSALSFLTANSVDMDKRQLAEICAQAEYFVGTAGGGMDQAASLLGKKDTFLKMDFNPLRVQPIPAPSGMQLVLFHSLVHAEKSGQMREAFNRRVLECRMGVDLFNSYAQEHLDHYEPVDYIGEVNAVNLSVSSPLLDETVDAFLSQLLETYTLQQFLDIYSLSENELFEKYKAVMRSDRIVEPGDGFKIKNRFKHVYSECKRVDGAIDCLQSGDMKTLGELINASHSSLARDYEISTSEVDRLVALLNDNGALGARIMGAGFGGIVVALTSAETKDRLIESIQNTYYKDRYLNGVNEPILACVAGDGAGVIQL